MKPAIAGDSGGGHDAAARSATPAIRRRSGLGKLTGVTLPL